MNWTLTSSLTLFLLGAGAAFAQAEGSATLLCLFALIFGVEAWRGGRENRLAAWHALARGYGGTYHRPERIDVRERFGQAPWTDPVGGLYRAALVIDASAHAPPFWVVQTPMPGWYPGDDPEDQAPDVVVAVAAVVRVGSEAPGALVEFPVGDTYRGMVNGTCIFVWQAVPGRLPGTNRLADFLSRAFKAAALWEQRRAAENAVTRTMAGP